MSEKAKILVLDDEPSITEIVSEFVLLSNDVDLIVCNSSSDAIKRAKVEKFSVIITDHHMPENSGIDVLASLRVEGGKNEKTPVVFLTAMNSEIQEQIYGKFDDVQVLNKVEKLHEIGNYVKDILLSNL